MYVDMYTQECPHMFNIVQQSMYNDVSNIITYTFLIGHGYLLHYYWSMYMIGQSVPSNQPQMGKELSIIGWLITIQYVYLFFDSPPIIGGT